MYYKMIIIGLVNTSIILQNYCFLFVMGGFFKKIYLFARHERVHGGKEKTSPADSALSMETDVGLGLTTLKS